MAPEQASIPMTQGGKPAMSSESAARDTLGLTRTALPFWSTQWTANTLFERAALRGEAGYEGQRRAILETLIAPVWFRILITQESVDEEYLVANISRVLEQMFWSRFLLRPNSGW